MQKIKEELEAMRQKFTGNEIVFIIPKWFGGASVEDQKDEAYMKYRNPTFVEWGGFREDVER